MYKSKSIKRLSNETYHIWKKEEIRESIGFDYTVLISLSAPMDSYIQHYFRQFLLNRNYLYSLKKIIIVCPFIFQIDCFKKRAIDLLKANLELLETTDMDIIQTYIVSNYDLDVHKIDFNIQELEQFKEENKFLLHQFNHLTLNPFDIEEFKKYYELLKLEHYLFFEDPVDISSISLETIYQFIEENIEDSIICGKEKLLDILASKRPFANHIHEYNHYLVMLNEVEEIDPVTYMLKQCSRRQTILDFIKNNIQIMRTEDISRAKKICESKQYDLGNFEAYLTSDFEFEKIKEYLKQTDYPISIHIFLQECPSMFMDPTIYHRTMELLKSYDSPNAKQVIKKLEKMMKR